MQLQASCDIAKSNRTIPAIAIFFYAAPSGQRAAGQKSAAPKSESFYKFDSAIRAGLATRKQSVVENAANICARSYEGKNGFCTGL